jgi:hypothetical protein
MDDTLVKNHTIEMKKKNEKINELTTSLENLKWGFDSR